MAEEIILVAGNPDAYPVEFYDEETGSYEGLIPELLQRFSDSSGYEVQYYEPGNTDRRGKLARNLQVDVISGCLDTEEFENISGSAAALDFTDGDGTSSYQLYFTEAAPRKFRAELASYLRRVSQEQKNGMLIREKAVPVSAHERHLRSALIGAGVLIFLMLLAVIGFVRHYRRRLRLLEHDRERDEVVGLGNRDYLFRYYEQYINDHNKVLYNVLYLYMDTNRLDQVSGRAQTDELLRYAAMVLQDHCADTDILARISDEGFVLVRMSIDEEEQQRWFRPVAERLDGRLLDSRLSAGTRYWAMGSYHIRQTDHDLNQMIFDTSQCARAAYQAGENYRLCTDEVLRTLNEERQLKADIEHGLEHGEFLLYLQMYVDARTGDAVGAEALSRWNHPRRGQLLPGDFMPFMERENLVRELDYCCLDHACRFLDSLRQRGKEDFFVSCNVSRETAADPDFPEKCRELLERYDFPRKCLIFETEGGASFEYTSRLSGNVREIRALGVSFAVDDFGQGFGPFARLGEDPPEILKVDRRLVWGIGTEAGESILRGMIQVCREMKILVMAVGVENEGQAAFLRGNGCDVLQGYLFYRPMPEWETRKVIMGLHMDLSGEILQSRLDGRSRRQERPLPVPETAGAAAEHSRKDRAEEERASGEISRSVHCEELREPGDIGPVPPGAERRPETGTGKGSGALPIMASLAAAALAAGGILISRFYVPIVLLNVLAPMLAGIVIWRKKRRQDGRKNSFGGRIS